MTQPCLERSVILNLNFSYATLIVKEEHIMTEVFVKLMNKGLKYHEHDKFSFDAPEGSTVRDLIDDLRETHAERFEPYLEDKESGKLRRDAIVLVNGKNMVAHQGEMTKLSRGDLIVFMIAAVGG